jgi:alanine dehydrogenase
MTSIPRFCSGNVFARNKIASEARFDLHFGSIREPRRRKLSRFAYHGPLTRQRRSRVMHIGVPKEIKNHEYRAGMTPDGVRTLIAAGHQVTVQTQLGAGIGIDDAQYAAAGAQVAPDAKTVFSRAQLIVKVKEPQPGECAMLSKDQVLFTYLHLAADRAQADGLMKSGAVAIAYETVTAADGSLPLLTPMSEVAGRMSVQVGAHYLEKAQGGRGVLLGGVPGVAAGKVLIIGGGVSGTHAAWMAVGMRADVTILDRSAARLRQLEAEFAGRARVLFSSHSAIESAAIESDLVIGAVLIPGAAAPKLLTRDMLRRMPRGSVVVDIAIDQGGCFETSRPTSHAQPIYVEEGVTHYCVTNMPGAVPRTSTFALTNVTLPYVHKLADQGWQRATERDPGLRNGLTVVNAKVVHPAVARDLGLAT